MSEEVKRDPAERERIIASWTKLAKGEMKRAVPVSDRVRRGSRHLRGVIRAWPRRQFGEIEGSSFTFPRHGVLAEMGVFGGLTKEQAIAQGKLDPRPWFNPALDSNFPKLQDDIGELYVKAFKQFEPFSPRVSGKDKSFIQV